MDVLAFEGFTRMIPGMKGLSNEEWLRALGLYSEFRKMREDLIDSYRMLRGLDRVDVEKMFPLEEDEYTYNFKWYTQYACPEVPLDCIVTNEVTKQQYDLS
eukprot:g25033.t1